MAQYHLGDVPGYWAGIVTIWTVKQSHLPSIPSTNQSLKHMFKILLQILTSLWFRQHREYIENPYLHVSAFSQYGSFLQHLDSASLEASPILLLSFYI